MRDNVAYRLHEEGMPEEDIEREVDLLLRFVKLENEVDKLPNELSGGMQKTRCYSTRAGWQSQDSFV